MGGVPSINPVEKELLRLTPPRWSPRRGFFGDFFGRFQFGLTRGQGSAAGRHAPCYLLG